MTSDRSGAADARPAAIILAAGVGRRLGSEGPKVLLRFGGCGF